MAALGRRSTHTESAVAKHTDDLELVQRLLARDGEAWREFVVRYERLILARVLATAQECRASLQQTDADDLVSEVFSTLLAREMASLRRFEGRSKLSTWLTVVARRVALKSMRPERERPLHEPARTAKEDVVRDVVAAEESTRLKDGMDELVERDRALLRMIYEDGLSHREVARRLNVSANSIGPLLQRARKRLRDRLEPDTDRYEPKLTPAD